MMLEDMKPIVLDFGKSGKVELAPVKHAHWKENYLPVMLYDKHRKKVFMCSRCNHAQQTTSVFCGGCGARMDGERDD